MLYIFNFPEMMDKIGINHFHSHWFDIRSSNTRIDIKQNNMISIHLELILIR